MNPRLLFANTTLVKRYVAEQFIQATQMIYRDHPVYTFDDSDETTSILIAPTYADTNQSGKKPKFLVQGGGYRFSLNDTLDKNFMQEIYAPTTGQYLGKRYRKNVNMMLMILVQAYVEEECSDLADELAMLCAAQAAHVYDRSNVSIIDIEVSETNVLDQEQQSFQTVVSLRVESVMMIDDLVEKGLPIDVGTGIDLPTTGNRPPDVEVFPTSRFRN